jgi:tRNA pseudouridine55 synthase
MGKDNPLAFGLLNIDKPSGPTSHDVVQSVRRGIGERRVGHAGTLDPLAGGVLVLALGPATRLIEYLIGSQKSYRALVKLGVSTDTYDAEGSIVEERPVPPDLAETQLRAALDAFTGEIEQIPPVYSAIKIGGKSAHARVRAGETVELKPRRIRIDSIDLLAFTPPTLELRVTCSAGTYIRSLAHDLGEALGCGAMLAGLTRTASGHFHLQDAVSWDTLQAAFEDGSWRDHLLSADRALEDTPMVRLSFEDLEKIRNGMPIQGTPVDKGLGRAYTPNGQFVAVLNADPENDQWRPKKVFTSLITSPE